MSALQDLSSPGWIVRRHPIVYYVFATILIVAFLKLGSDLLIPVVFATLISLTLSPAIERLERLSVPSPLSGLVVLTAATLLAASILWFLTIQIASLLADAGSYGQHFSQKVDQLLQIAGDILERFGLRSKLASWERLREWWRTSGQENVITVAGEILYGLRVPLGHFLGVYLLTFFLLLDRRRVRDRVYSLLGRKRLFSATVSIADATERIQRYLLAQGSINVACAIFAGTLCHLLGVPQPYLWGLLIGIGRYVPFIGFWVAVAIPVALCVVVHDGWTTAVTAVVCFAVLEVVLANLIEPQFIGKSVGLTTLGVICAAVFWGWVWGIPGVILGVPLTITLATLGKSIPQLQFLPVLVGEEVQGDAQLHFLHRLLVGDALSVVEQTRTGFTKIGAMPTLTELALPSIAEVHRLAVRPEDKINTNVKRALKALTEETSTLHSAGTSFTNLDGGSFYILSTDRRDTGILGETLCSFFNTMRARCAKIPDTALVSEVAEMCRNDLLPSPGLIIPILAKEDFHTSYRFLKRFLLLDPIPAQIIAFVDPTYAPLDEALSLLLEDERVRVIDSWGRLLDFCHELATSSRISQGNAH